MSNARLATVANPIIDRLNSIRVGRSGAGQDEVGQIRFRLNGLRLVDKSSYYAVSGMLSVVEQDADGLREWGRKLASEFPDDVHSHLNILRSYIARRMRPEARELARRLTAQIDNWSDASALLVCSIHNGDLEETTATAQAFQKLVAHDANRSDVGIVTEAHAIARQLLDSGVSSAEFQEFLDVAFDALAEKGWAAPHLTMDLPFVESCDEAPIAFARFYIDAAEDVDSMLDVEEAVMDSLLAAQTSLFRSSSICVAVRPAGDFHE